MRFFLFTLLFALITGCGLFSGSTSPNKGSEEIVLDKNLLSFNAANGQSEYKSYPFSNATNGPITLYNISFKNNICGAFAYYGLAKKNGQLIQTANAPLSYLLKQKEEVSIVIRFNPQPCPYGDYETIVFFIFRDKQNNVFWESAVLKVIGTPPLPIEGDGSPDAGKCEVFGDNVEFIEQPISGFDLTQAEDYYLKVTRMRGFIYPGKGFESQKRIIGSDIGDADEFISPYLKVTIHPDMSFTLDKIDPCDNFEVPSAVSDPHFIGQPTLITSDKAYSGKILAEEEIDPDNADEGWRTTHLVLDDITLTLRADNISSGSLIQSNGIFQISLSADLTTKYSNYTKNLADDLSSQILAQNLSEKSEKIFNLIENKDGAKALAGSPLIEGELMLVGVATFEDDNFIGTSEASAGLIENEAFLYFTLSAVLTKKEEIKP